MENTGKYRNYKGGEIRRTVDGYLFSSKGDAHNGPYVSIGSQRHGRWQAEAETPAVESADEAVEPWLKISR